MPEQEPAGGAPLGPLAALRRVVPFEATAASDGLGWAGLEAARYRVSPASELNPPPLTHHWRILFPRPPEDLDIVYDAVQRHGPPPPRAVSLVPAGSTVPCRWAGDYDA